jgi:hypothetical protein
MASEILVEYPSKSNPSKSYHISQDSNGIVWCDCPSWRFAGGDTSKRWCKHLEMYTNGISDDVKRKFKECVTQGTDVTLDAVTQEVIRQLKGEGYGTR